MSQAGGSTGKRIGPFVLDELIGTGPYAEVWRAHHAHLSGPELDIKLFTDRMIVQVLSNAEPIPWISGSRYLPQIVDFQPEHDPPFIATAHVEGKSLRQVLAAEGAMDLRRAMAVLAQLIGALKWAHHMGALHLDLKSENILLTEEDELHLLDLAVGRFSAETGKLYRDSSKLTSSIGRGLRYRSREQQKGGEIDERADVYSLGILLFEMVTGDLPQGAQLPTQANPELPRKLDHVFSRCCTKIEKRYPSVLDLEKDLRPRAATKMLKAADRLGDPEEPVEEIEQSEAEEEVVDCEASEMETETETETEGAPTHDRLKARLQSLEIVGSDDVAVVAMGEVCDGKDTIDGTNLESIIKNIGDLDKAGFRSVIMDFGDIGHVASTGFGYLVNMCDMFAERGGVAVIFNVAPNVSQIIEAMGLANYFTIVDSRDAALTAAGVSSNGAD